MKKYSDKVKAQAVSMIMAGSTLRQVESACGPSRQTISEWVRSANIEMRRDWIGGPVKIVKGAAECPFRIGLEQRLAIAAGLAAGLTHAEIAKGIGFSRSTVSREVSRHAAARGAYDPYRAHAEASESARRPKARKVDTSPRLREYVLGRLTEGWSPEQVSAMLAKEYPGDEEMSLSAESIYQALCVQDRGARSHGTRVRDVGARGLHEADRGQGALLRPALTLATRQQREHERPHPAVLPKGDRPPRCHRRGGRRSPEGAEHQAEQDTGPEAGWMATGPISCQSVQRDGRFFAR